MIVRIFKRKKLGRTNLMVEPDEIFLDSKNIQNFDTQQFEGRIEKPISKSTILAFGIVFIFLGLVFSARLIYLQLGKGEAYLSRSQNNTLEKVVLFTDRGIIYDRKKAEIAWNRTDEVEAGAPDIRTYKSPGFSHLLGYVSYPAKDKSGNYWQTEFTGKDGLEKVYDKVLKGENGSKITEADATGAVHSENIINAPRRGNDLITTVDAGVQGELFQLIKNLADGYSFSGGSGVMIDVTNGEVIASTSFPEYDSEVLSLGENKDAISGYMHDKRKVFLDRTISGLYTPGSIVKPYFALGALAEGVIDPYKKILSTGSISIPNPYSPGDKTTFKDWKAHGWTNMAEAIAVSSDVYFYEVGGGFEGQKGLGILNIEKYAQTFGLGEKTGVDLPDEKSGTIPSPDWKLKNFNGDPWRIGDTYHTAIGQYGFQVTPIEMARALASIANGGTLVTPHFVLGDTAMESKKEQLNFPKEYFDAVHDGMRQAVTYGTALALNVPYVDVAAKTGTAQVGALKNRVNSWVTAFFPYENPKYALVIMMESGPTVNSVSASTVGRQLFDWMSINTPEYFK
jgi:penicillin-binding protein 2